MQDSSRVSRFDSRTKRLLQDLEFIARELEHPSNDLKGCADTVRKAAALIRSFKPSETAQAITLRCTDCGTIYPGGQDHLCHEQAARSETTLKNATLAELEQANTLPSDKKDELSAVAVQRTRRYFQAMCDDESGPDYIMLNRICDAALEALAKRDIAAPSAIRQPCPYCTSDNPAIRSTYYDQTCEGCVKRMGRP